MPTALVEKRVFRALSRTLRIPRWGGWEMLGHTPAQTSGVVHPSLSFTRVVLTRTGILLATLTAQRPSNSGRKIQRDGYNVLENESLLSGGSY